MTRRGCPRRAPCRACNSHCGWPNSTTCSPPPCSRSSGCPHRAAVASRSGRRDDRPGPDRPGKFLLLVFTITGDTDALRLDVQVPAAHVDVLDALAQRAAARMTA
ncbi:hypothetical protein NKG94_51480 [Micromonospora sp. M12]